MILASKSFTSLSALQAEIMKQVNSVLQVEEAEMVKDKIEMHVQTDVYDAYPHPIMYKRRNFHSGSLGDIAHMDSHLLESGLLEVVDNADFNHPFAYKYGGYGDIDLDKSLAENIEKGYGSMSEEWNEPRPFIKNTREEIRNSNLHTTTMKKGLQARGLTVV